MHSNIQTVGKSLKKEVTAAPDVVANGAMLETRQETCEAIEQHARKLIERELKG